jgi:hypothetical protein
VLSIKNYDFASKDLMDLLRGNLGVQNSKEPATLPNVLEANPIRDECTEVFDLIM